MASERLVLDASYVLEAILPTSGTWQFEAFDSMDRIASGDIEAHVPWVFFAEVAATVTRKTRGGRVDPQDALAFLLQVDALGLHVDPPGARSLALHQAALRWHAGAYDAIYLDLAARLAAALATRDGGMATAARAAGVSMF